MPKSNILKVSNCSFKKVHPLIASSIDVYVLSRSLFPYSNSISSILLAKMKSKYSVVAFQLYFFPKRRQKYKLYLFSHFGMLVLCESFVLPQVKVEMRKPKVNRRIDLPIRNRDKDNIDEVFKAWHQKKI
jgi:hypothetical protein